jgi:hypothetical protein
VQFFLCFTILSLDEDDEEFMSISIIDLHAITHRVVEVKRSHILEMLVERWDERCI